ncbi:hypothetical protein D3C76_1604590 [compost metagenome]
MFKQRAAAQKGGGWRCYLDNTAIAVNVLPAMARDLASTVQNLSNRFDLAAFIGDVRTAGVETTPGRRIRRIR